MDIYTGDSPFVVLGNLYESVFLRSPLFSYLSGAVVGMYDFKQSLFEQVTFGEQRFIVRDNVFNGDNLRSFLNQDD